MSPPLLIPEPSLLDKLLLIPLLGKVLVAALYRAITLPIRSKNAKASKPFKDIMFAVLRAQLSSISVSQEQFLNSLGGSTESNYITFAKQADLSAETDVLGSGLKLHWIGSRTAKKVILWFHGGGYAMACNEGHWKWLSALQKTLTSEGKDVGIGVVGYTLAPKGQYPMQLREAAESLEWLTKKYGKYGKDIIIAGDSAGGNLAMGLLSHLLHPHPDVSEVTLDEPLAAALLVSPWISFSTTDSSYKRNATTDMLPPSAIDRWVKLFLGSRPSDEYSEASRADASWFSGLGSIVKDVLIWGGEKEVLLDSIQALGKTLTSAHPRVEIVIEPGAAHEDFIFDTLFGYTEKGQGTTLIESWLTVRL